MFGAYEEEDKVSIHELAKTLQRKLKSKNSQELRNLSRYVIEPRLQPQIVPNELLEESLLQIIDKLQELVQGYAIFTPENEKLVQEALVAKLSTRMFSLIQTLRSIETEPDIITCENVEQLSKILTLQLTTNEQDYITLLMYRVSKDVKKLPYQVLIQKLEELGCKVDQEEVKAPSSDNIKEEIQELQEQIKLEQKESAELPSGHKLDKKRKAISEPNELEDVEPMGEEIGEEEIVEIAQRCFMQMAEKMLAKKMTIKTLYQGTIQKANIGGEEMDVLNAADFMDGLKRLGINELQSVEFECLIKALAANETEELISVDNLAQILEDYGIVDQTAERKNSGGFLKFEQLDEISMVLMLALAEYLIQAKIPLYELFGKAIYTQTVTTKTKQRTVELIDSHEFFIILREIGISLEDAEHENLKAFLCLDPKYKDKLYVKKIKKAIEEFAFNEELRTFARNCYKDLGIDEEEESVKHGGEVLGREKEGVYDENNIKYIGG